MPVERCKNCARDARTMEGYCCEACSRLDVGIHTPECNRATWPEWAGARYIHDEEAAAHLVERIQQVLGLTHVLETQLKEITSAARQFIPNYPASGLELMVNHLHIDIQYIEDEARKLLK